MARSRYKFVENDYPYFLTCTVVNWLPILCNPYVVQIILNSFSFLQKEKRLTLIAYVVMENHLHFIAYAENLSKEVAAFRSFTARSIIDYCIESNNQFMLFQLKQNKQKHKTDREYKSGKRKVTLNKSKMTKY
jgi:putative transposase